MTIRDGDPDDLEQLIENPNIAFQRKHDGHRRPVVVTGTGPMATTVGLNRSGEPSTLPPNVAHDLNGIGDITLDAELMMTERRLVVFDVIQFGSAITPASPLRTRLTALDFIFKNHPFGSSVELVSTATTADEKRALIAQIEAEGGEGWVAKPLTGHYKCVPKSRTPWLRFKRRADIDCVVVARGSGRDHLVLGLYDGDQLHVVGTVTALAGDGPRAQPGDVVRCRLMGVTPHNRLREPTLPLIRTDGKRPAECTVAQLDELRLRTR